MEKQHILGTGLNGLVGSRVMELLNNTYTFDNISRTTGVDITNKEQVTKAITNSKAGVVIHMAAKADVDGCEKDKDQKEKGEAWRVNVEATKFIADACVSSGKKLIYISTDFVFDGDNTPDGGYTEEADPYPVNWYAHTKYLGEQMVIDSGVQYVIARIAYPYRVSFEKNDFVRAIMTRLQKGEKVAGVVDHIFCPTFIDDIAHALQMLIQKNASGIYHATGSQALSPYDAARLIAEEFGYDTNLVSKTTRAEFFSGRANRPFNLTMKNGKIEALGVKMRTLQDGLQEFKTHEPKDTSTT